MKPGKSFARLEFAGEAWVLQWGHGDEAVEEAAGEENAVGARVASMGPRR